VSLGQKVIREHCELVKLCHINRTVRFFETVVVTNSTQSCHVYRSCVEGVSTRKTVESAASAPTVAACALRQPVGGSNTSFSASRFYKIRFLCDFAQTFIIIIVKLVRRC